MERSSKIYVAGHRGLVGSAIWRNLESKGYTNLVGRTSAELDLRDQKAVEAFFASERPEFVFLAAAKVGGILANNTYRAEFIYDNLMIQNNVIHQAYVHGVKRLLFLGSTCIYPKNAPQPMKEEYLLTGPLEPTNEPYAIAKIAGIKMCESYNRQYGTDFMSVMPTNLYGPNDNFDPETSHVLPALLRRIHEAKVADSQSVTIWGTGTPLREFLYVDDMADACVFLMQQAPHHAVIPATAGTPFALHSPVIPATAGTPSALHSPVIPATAGTPSATFLNIGTGSEISIKDLAYLIKDIVGFPGDILFDPTKPDGTPRKLTDVSRLHAMGWRHTVELREGIERVYEWMKRDPQMRTDGFTNQHK